MESSLINSPIVWTLFFKKAIWALWETVKENYKLTKARTEDDNMVTGLKILTAPQHKKLVLFVAFKTFKVFVYIDYT